MRPIILALFGSLFGTVLILSGATSWEVMNDMFHFRSFQMFGVIGGAIGTAGLGVILIRKLKLRSLTQTEVDLKRKPVDLARNGIGGILFGIGWGITGACTAPIFLRVGSTPIIGLLMILSAVAGAAVYKLILKRR